MACDTGKIAPAVCSINTNLDFPWSAVHSNMLACICLHRIICRLIFMLCSSLNVLTIDKINDDNWLISNRVFVFYCYQVYIYSKSYHSVWTLLHSLYTNWFVHQANTARAFMVHQGNAAGAFIVHQGNVVEHFGSYIKAERSSFTVHMISGKYFD